MKSFRDELHSLMKKQWIAYGPRLMKIENLEKEYGSDEALWQAEVERQQALVDALGDKARRTRDITTPKLFVQLALEYIKQSVSVDAALSILDDLSENKSRGSRAFSKELFDNVIMKHDHFQRQQENFGAFITWRGQGSSGSNRTLLTQFISEIGAQEQKARLQAILTKETMKSKKRKRVNDLNSLAEAASQLQASKSEERESGADLWTDIDGALPPGTEETPECVERSVQESGEVQMDCSNREGEGRALSHVEDGAEVSSTALSGARRTASPVWREVNPDSFDMPHCDQDEIYGLDALQGSDDQLSCRANHDFCATNTAPSSLARFAQWFLCAAVDLCF